MTSAALTVCALVSWGAVAGYLFFLHRKISTLEKMK